MTKSLVRSVDEKFQDAWFAEKTSNSGAVGWLPAGVFRVSCDVSGFSRPMFCRTAAVSPAIPRPQKDVSFCWFKNYVRSFYIVHSFWSEHLIRWSGHEVNVLSLCSFFEVSMGTGETLVELTNCDLVLSGAGITFYSAFVYVPWNSHITVWPHSTVWALLKVVQGGSSCIQFVFIELHCIVYPSSFRLVLEMHCSISGWVCVPWSFGRALTVLCIRFIVMLTLDKQWIRGWIRISLDYARHESSECII